MLTIHLKCTGSIIGSWSAVQWRRMPPRIIRTSPATATRLHWPIRRRRASKAVQKGKEITKIHNRIHFRD